MMSSVYFAEDDVLRPDDRDNVRDHVPARHFVERCQMRKSRRADFQAIRHVGAVGNQVNTEFALGMLEAAYASPGGTCMPSVKSLK